MSWLFYFGVAVIITAFAAVTGVKARGTRHVSHTSLMAVARLALWAIAMVFAFLAIRAYSAA